MPLSGKKALKRTTASTACTGSGAADRPPRPVARADPRRSPANYPRTIPPDCRLQKQAYAYRYDQGTSDHG